MSNNDLKSRDLWLIAKGYENEDRYKPGNFFRYYYGIEIGTGDLYYYALNYGNNPNWDLVNPPVHKHVRVFYKKRYDAKPFDKWTGKYYADYSDKTVASRIFAKDVEIIGHQTGEAEMVLDVSELKYGNGVAWHEELGIAIEDEFIPDINFSPLINEIKEDLNGTIHIKGEAYIVKRKINGQWMDVPKWTNETVIQVTDYDLADFKTAYTEHQLNSKVDRLIAWLNKVIRTERKLISEEEARAMANELGIPEEYDVEEALASTVMRKDYDRRCFEALRSRADPNSPKYFGFETFGFIFNVKGETTVVMETPKAGKATYAIKPLNGSPVAEVVQIYDKCLKKVVQETAKDSAVASELGFVYKGRVIHNKTDPDEENDKKLFNRWLTDVISLIES